MRPRGVKRLFSFSSRTREEVHTDIRDEFQFHLDMRVADLMRDGLSEADARAQAAREFGNPRTSAAAIARHDDRIEQRRRFSTVFGEIKQDALIALRLLGRSPGFAAVAILTLAIGIGANTAIFSALDAVLLRPLPYPAPDRLVEVFERLPNGNQNSVAGGVFLDWKTRSTQFDAMAIFDIVRYNLRGDGAPERLMGTAASHDFPHVLGVRPLLGRGFIEEDDRPGGRNDVVIITEELWRSRFGGDPSIVNSQIVLDDVSRTVVGVLPRGAWPYREHQFFVPSVLAANTPRGQRAPHWGVVIGRLKPGATIEGADAELKSIKQSLVKEYPGFKAKWSVGVRSLTETVAGTSRPSLLILLGAVSLVLLIACANVANLLLARSHQRQQEIALRAALGATSGRIVRQVLTESVVLAVIGGVAGLALAFWSVRLLQYLTEQIAPGAPAPRLDGRVLMFSLALTAATGLIFGILPALRARRPDLNDTLKNGGKSATAGGRQRAQSTLVVAEVALTVILLSAAGLMMRSLANTASADPGFEPSRVLAFDVSLPSATYETGEKRMTFWNQLRARVATVPGVEYAGEGMAIPFSGGGFGENFSLPGKTSEDDFRLGRLNYVSPGYLEALGTRLIAGRYLTDADNVFVAPPAPNAANTARAASAPNAANAARAASAPNAPNAPNAATTNNANNAVSVPRGPVVINQTAARFLFGARSPIDQTIVVASQQWRVAGVIADVTDRRLDAASRPFAYVPQAFNPGNYSMVLRTRLDPSSLVNSVRAEIARLDPGVALANPRALNEAMAQSLTPRKTMLSLVGAFALTALVLACIGLYGVMAYSVGTRRREICIRMALGAERGAVIGHVLKDGIRLMIVGVFIGVAAALAIARLLTSELYQVSTYDPLVIVGTIASVATVAIFACWMPAWRAARFDPISSLRGD
jgi:predicted permease